MICAEARELLESYVKGSTDAAAREALEAHFATCEGCRLEAELTRSVHAESGLTEDGVLELEPLTTAQLPDDYLAPPGAGSPGPGPVPPLRAAPDNGDDEEMSFKDLILEAPEATSTAAPVAPAAPKPMPKPSAPVWDFEPTEPLREAGPPAESLNLAEQAIARKAEAKAKGKHAALRVALWAAGGLSGIALLGVSIWIALAFNQEPPADPSPAARHPRTGTPGVGEVAPPGGPEDPVSVATDLQGVPADGSGETTPVPPPADGSVADPNAGVETAPSPDGRVLRAGTLAPTGSGSDVIVATPSKQGTSAPAGSAAKPPSTGAKSATTAPPSARTTTTRSTAVAPKPGTETTSSGAASGGSKKPIGPRPPVDDLEPVADESEIPFAAAPKRDATPTPSAAGSTQAGGTAKPPAPAASGPAAAPSAGAEGGASTTTTEPAPAPAPSRPIDRLHEATVQAAAAEDLEALRKHKIAWKSLIRTATASERARAKREYADCLWAIQELSGRIPDRREALAAYREYVLYAPAGANDSRTVGRMRFLEDVLSESE